MAKYVRVPLQVEAYQYKSNGSEEEKASLIRWMKSTEVITGWRFNNNSITISRGFGKVRVWNGQWIIHGALDEIYAIGTDEFEAYYLPVMDGNPPSVTIPSPEQ